MASPMAEAMMAVPGRAMPRPLSPQAEAMRRAMGIAAAPDAVVQGNPDASLDNLMTSDEYQKVADERAERTPVAKEGDPGVVSIAFDDRGEAHAPKPHKRARKAAR